MVREANNLHEAITNTKKMSELNLPTITAAMHESAVNLYSVVISVNIQIFWSAQLMIAFGQETKQVIMLQISIVSIIFATLLWFSLRLSSAL